ncbi:MAG TPA: HEPN domain-containing protein [Chthoniobacterales bacterium]
MTPLEQFNRNILGAEKYLEMYYELRKLKKLGRRGALDATNRYLLWLPRATVVSAVGALDAYIHDILALHIPRLLADASTQISESLATLLGRVISTKKREDVQDMLRFIRSTTGPQSLAHEVRESVCRFESYQAPAKVVGALKVLGIQDVLADAAGRWQGPQTTRDNIAMRLDRYVKRRNQIAHEADLDTHGEPRAISPNYAWDCKEFIKALVERIDPSVQ